MRKHTLTQTTLAGFLKQKGISAPTHAPVSAATEVPAATYIHGPVRGDKHVLYPRRKNNPSTTMVQGRKRQLSHRNNYNKYLSAPKRWILDL